MVSTPTGHVRSKLGWAILKVLLGLETLGLVAVLGFTIVRSIAEPGDVTQEVSLVLMSAVSLAWVAVTFFGVVRSRASWARSSAVAIHVLTFAGGTGCLQLGIGPWWLGLGIVAIALIGFAAAIMARPEVAQTGA
ncbi:hypothetical protein [Leucobacter salsicius]|uniref:hypothetical protein n=1 Tax=Leucobacter salsicius TaxID=664638 RepID=UPI00034A1359|nr:hypothetical protein [Leucobacter salsicius]